MEKPPEVGEGKQGKLALGQNPQGPKRAERWKDKREGARGNQYKQREVMERDWARKAKENREEKEEENRARRRGRKKADFLPKKTPAVLGPETPQTGRSPAPSPDRPAPLPGPGRLQLVSLRSVYF